MGVDQTTFGEMAGGVTYQTVSDWENEHSQPPRSRLRALADRLGLPIEAFGQGGPKPADLVQAPVKVVPGMVAERRESYDPALARHTPQTTIRLRVAAQLEARVLSAGEAVSRETALSLIREMSDAWARWEATRSAEAGEAGSRQAG
jgi:hypothetical protein